MWLQHVAVDFFAYVIYLVPSLDALVSVFKSVTPMIKQPV